MNSCLYIRTLAVQLIAALLVIIVPLHGYGQHDVEQFKVSDNSMRILLSRRLSLAKMDSFIAKYNLGDIGLHRFLHNGMDDSLILMGWTINLKDPGIYKFTKDLNSAELRNDYPGNMIFTPVPTPENWRVIGGNKIVYGTNHFEDGQQFRREKDIIYFQLKGYPHARQVKLAGNFTNWQHGAFPMNHNNDGWTVPVQLKPGQYFYKFIVNGNWMTDPANELSENDGRGNENSVLFVPNRSFELKGYHTAQQVYLTGDFSNWAGDKLPMYKTKDGWRVDMYLEPGTWSYRFIVDGKTVWNEVQPVISIGEPYVFSLKGYERAKKVYLTGNFNNWKESELPMKRTAEGWEVPYVLGAGNYQYKFIVDGEWVTDPGNPAVINDGKGNQNSFIVIGPNYTFRLKGHAEAKKVSLAGDFNNWSPEGLPMKKEGNTWVSKVYLAKGKHLYKFLVDGKWILDPANNAWEENEFGTGNSVLWLDPPVQRN